MHSKQLLPLCAALAFAAPLLGQSFSDVVVFGDSLCDNGNLHAAVGLPPPPYWEGRFSDGPVWVEQLANRVGLAPGDITDLAVGGATTQQILDQQVVPFVTSAGGAIASDALYVVWGGANDLQAFFESGSSDPTPVIAAALQNTANSILVLVSSGAQTILVPNIPDVSKTPDVCALGDPQLAGAVQQVCAAYDAYLAQTLAVLRSATGANLIELDTFALTDELAAHPHDFGFKHVAHPALAQDGTVAKHCERHMFWDGTHPTTRTHSFIMGAALGALGILWGDVDGDGSIGGSDVAALVQQFGPSQPGAAADMNGDGSIDGRDLQLLRLVMH